MSSKKRTSRSLEHDPNKMAGSPERTAESLFDSGLGNEGFQRSLGRHSGSAGAIDLDVVTATARPVLQHTMMALQLMAPSAERLSRFQEILAASKLSADLKLELSSTLALKDAQATTVQRAMIDHFGSDSEALRGEVWTCLHQCWQALHHGQVGADPQHWVMASGAEVSLGEVNGEMSLTERANQMVGDVAEHVAGDSLRSLAQERGGTSATVRGLCRALYLAVNFDEEEEEEEWAAPEME